MSLFEFIKKFLPENKYERKERYEKELNLHLYHCESLFFENGIHHTMNDEHRIVFLIAIRLLYPGREKDVNCRRHQIWKHFNELYRYSDKEMQSYCDDHPVDGLFEVFMTLPKTTRMGIMLILDCMLYIDRRPTNDKALIVKAVMSLMEIEYPLYNQILSDLKEKNTFTSLNHIYEHSYKREN